ncbi:hypothetical protein SAMN05443999_10338 [Roseovarius azorensis]|uniref:Oxidoreductase molybdopterin-binding domain-containing protein n=1 Tax=Roseovarius azorensis TaxID=1287727 RepID=A0A1H7LE35_9RHOB|nr:molybdopterin-dependent oxidoreductase [Roseovarius azorensis]SEK97159.1 hypothetical protein SAMN05443999_10338 [Roseovarius azorensis]
MYRRALTSGFLAAALAALARPSMAATADDAFCVIMTITYDMPRNDQTGAITLTEDQIRDLPRLTFNTTTIWTSGVQKFTGVPLRALLDHYGLEGREIVLSAANDYRITIPMSEIRTDAPMIAYERNDRPMSLRDYGPLWLVYNYDGDAANRTQTVFSRSIWQLDHITVKR